VDGDRVSSRALRLIVEYDGHEVQHASDGAEAVALVDEFRPHVMLVDPNAPSAAMPVESSRSDRMGPAIILTSSSPALPRRGVRGVVAQITRPFDFVELRLLVSREVARRTAAPAPRTASPEAR
jgi:DNA-binding response OmpR family regulator